MAGAWAAGSGGLEREESAVRAARVDSTECCVAREGVEERMVLMLERRALKDAWSGEVVERAHSLGRRASWLFLSSMLDSGRSSNVEMRVVRRR
jgi:hypothetical protein